jgi:hypothetical protein
MQQPRMAAVVVLSMVPAGEGRTLLHPHFIIYFAELCSWLLLVKLSCAVAEKVPAITSKNLLWRVFLSCTE